MKKIVLSIIMAFSIMTAIHAQVVTWSVKPGAYSKIEPCWENLYFVYDGSNNVGVINGEGGIIVPLYASRITGFYGGLALVLKADVGQERILGILSSDGVYSKIEGTYYTIPYQEFFSEGLLTVLSQSGQAGYMNVNGVVVRSFNTTFVSPFSEGYAVVGENEEYSIIDKRFNVLSIMLGSVSQVYGGSNVYNGIATVWDGNGKFYSFDVNRGTCNKTSKPGTLDYDYMYCFSAISKRSANVPYEQPKRFMLSMSAILEDGKYGYADNNGKIILPCQMDFAENFYGEHAIVKTNGKYGLLSLHKTNETFFATPRAEIKYRRSAGKRLAHKFSIMVPSLWSAGNLVVRVKDESGMPIDVTNNDGMCEFRSDGGIGTKKYDVEIDGDGLKLWKGELAYNYKVESEPVIVHEPIDRPIGNFKPLTVTIKASNTQADKNNRCYVKATVSNPNADAITATVTIIGTNLLEAVSKRITVPAHGTKDISTYFIVKKAVSGQKVTVSTSAGGTASLTGLQLIPF